MSLLNFSFCLVLFPDFTELSAFSCSSLNFLKTAIVNSLLGSSSCFGDQLLEDYCAPLMVSCFLDSSCSLKFCVSVFISEVVVISSSFYHLPSPMHPNSYIFFLLQQCAITFSAENLDFQKGSLV